MLVYHKKTYLKIPTMLIHTENLGNLGINSITPKRGNRMDFSCTWKEKRKKLKDETVRVIRKLSNVGLKRR